MRTLGDPCTITGVLVRPRTSDPHVLRECSRMAEAGGSLIRSVPEEDEGGNILAVDLSARSISLAPSPGKSWD